LDRARRVNDGYAVASDDRTRQARVGMYAPVGSAQTSLSDQAEANAQQLSDAFNNGIGETIEYGGNTADSGMITSDAMVTEGIPQQNTAQPNNELLDNLMQNIAFGAMRADGSMGEIQVDKNAGNFAALLQLYQETESQGHGDLFDQALTEMGLDAQAARTAFGILGGSITDGVQARDSYYRANLSDDERVAYDQSKNMSIQILPVELGNLEAAEVQHSAQRYFRQDGLTGQELFFDMVTQQGQHMSEDPFTVSDIIVGTGEFAAGTILNVGSELLAGLAMVARSAVTWDMEEGLSAYNDISENLKWEMKSRGGQNAQTQMSYLLGGAVEMFNDGTQALGDAAYESTGSPLLGTLAYIAPQAITELGGARVAKGMAAGAKGTANAVLTQGQKLASNTANRLADFKNNYEIEYNLSTMSSGGFGAISVKRVDVPNTSMLPNDGPNISPDLLLSRKQLEISGDINLKTFDFGTYLKSTAGDPPIGMPDPHAHHVLFKKGLGEKQQALVVEGQDLLRKYEIDPILGSENLVWAPNRIKGQHDIKALQQVTDTLKMTDEMIGTREAMIDALNDLGTTAANRR